jgi:histidinol-phosphatase (PHP family)
MAWSNFHTHCNYCDGKGELTDFVTEAKRLNMLSIGFSSHAPVPFPTKWCMRSERFPDYLNAIEKIKASNPGVEIYKGLEVDFIPGITSPNLFKDKLDYTVGSIHFVDQLPDGTHWEIDGLHTFFLEGYTKIFNSNIRDAISRYFELTREMISTACPSVVGHMDKIKIQNVDGKFFNETDSWYQDEVKKTIDAIDASGAIVEVNTRGIYQKKSATTYPSPWILEILHRKNIPLTISSDAHHKDDITNQFSQTAALLKNIGFKTIRVLHDNTWKPFDFTEDGLVR